MVELIEWIEIFSLAFLIGTLVVTFYYSYKSMKELKNQLKLTIFTNYTNRYSEIRLKLPNAINYENFSIHNLEKEDKDKILRYGRAYFDLCLEEYYLYKTKKIDDDIWKLWSEPMSYTIKLKGFREIWNEIKQEGYESDFKRLIETFLNK